MARWLVEREGERFDLDEYPYWFPSGEIFAIADGEKVFLVGDAFEMLQVAGQVRERASQAVDELSAVIAILALQGFAWGGVRLGGGRNRAPCGGRGRPAPPRHHAPGESRRANRAWSCGPGVMASWPPCGGRSTTAGPTGSPRVRHPRRARGWPAGQGDPAVLPLLIATPKAAPASRRPPHGPRLTAPASRRPPHGPRLTAHRLLPALPLNVLDA